MLRIKMDTVIEATEDAVAALGRDWAELYEGVSIRLTDGLSGNGWPVLEITGRYSALGVLLVEQYDLEMDEAEALLELAEAV